VNSHNFTVIHLIFFRENRESKQKKKQKVEIQTKNSFFCLFLFTKKSEIQIKTKNVGNPNKKDGNPNKKKQKPKQKSLLKLK
jgi:hypothetical protein